MFLAFAALTVCAATIAAPRTWIVAQDGSGDFWNIPPALAAASDGDVILVRPSLHGTPYDGFTLNKKVTVKAETVVVPVGAGIVIDSIPAGSGGAVVSGIAIVAGTIPLLTIDHCDGDVVVDNVSLSGGTDVNDTSSIVITSSSSVNLYECSSTVNDFTTEAPLVNVADSTVRASRSDWAGGLSFYGGIGQTCLYLDHSTFVLEEPTIRGGSGIGVDGWMGHFSQVPGTGGTAVEAHDSTIWIVGDEKGSISGGDGGTYYDGYNGSQWYGKPGGAGLALFNTDCIVSRCSITGGWGAPKGPDYSNDPYTRDDTYPFLWLEPELHVGQSTTVTLDATSPGTAILLLSDQGGVGDAGPKWLGPPLAVLVGTTLYVEDLGNLDANGDWFETVNVPNDPNAAGMTWHLQAAVLAQSGALYLTNPVARTIGL
jgi:hypothetical protein